MTRIQRIFSVLVALAVLTLAGCAGTESSRSTGTYIDDKAISAKVEAGLARFLRCWYWRDFGLRE